MDTTNATLQPQSSPLLDLPPEMRNEIYLYVLTEEQPVYVFCKKAYTKRFKLYNSAGLHYWHPPPLLQVCPQILTEASQIYYSTNQFTVVEEDKWPRPLRMWIAVLTAENVRNLTDVRIQNHVFSSTSGRIDYFKRFWSSLQGTDLAVSKDVLRMKLPVWKRLPCKGKRGDFGAYQVEWLSVSRIERARVVYDTILEDDLGTIKNEAV